MSRFVLVDCNNFYVSCERLFCPKLAKRPVIVLSNNDGCVIARSNEAKALGIAMGQPFFEVRALCKAHDIAVFSSNYRLYGDLSERIMTILSEHCPEIEVYSIDEAFLQFPPGTGWDVLYRHCITLRKKILQWVGIPVSMGLAPTKTLCKVANKVAKKRTMSGILPLAFPQDQSDLLNAYPVEDLWGIGSGYRKRLARLGIHTAEQLRVACLVKIRKLMGVVGERIVRELNGISCLPLEIVAPKKSIMCSRSFSTILQDQDAIAEALSSHVATASEKLRREGSCTQAIEVFLSARLQPGTNLRDFQSAVIPLETPSCDTGELITLAKEALGRIFREGRDYKKVGIVMLDLIPTKYVSRDLFAPPRSPKRERVLAAVDALNSRFGKQTLFYGAMGIARRWQTRSTMRSPRYTTSWQELVVVA